jgi:histidine triad (HIT) family protein
MSDCLFCKIVAGEIPAKVVAESETCLAFYDIAPQAPVHVLIIPKAHFASVNELTATNPSLYVDLFLLCDEVVTTEGIKESGHRLVFNTGVDGQQTVEHIHMHVFGGRRLTWPPG